MYRSLILVAVCVIAAVCRDDPAPTRAGGLPSDLEAQQVGTPTPNDLSRGCLARFGDARLRHPAPVRSLALTPDGKTLAVTAADEPLIRLWDVATARLIRELRDDTEFTTSLTLIGFAGDARRLIIVRHQSRQSGRPNPWHEPATIDTRTGAVTRWLWGQETEYYLPVFAVSPDGKAVAGLTRYCELKVWEVDSGREVHTLGRLETAAHRVLGGVCYSPDGASVAACCDKEAVHVAPADGSRTLRKLPVETQKKGIGSVFWVTPNRLVALWYGGLVALDPATGQQLGRKEFDGNMISNPQTAGRGLLYVKEGSDKDVVAIDLATLQKVPGRVFRGSQQAEPFALSADGETLALATGHAVQLFRAATGEPLHPDLARYPANPADRLQLSADGRTLLTAGGRSAQTWDLPAGRLCAEFNGLGRSFRSPSRLVLSLDGRHVAGGYTPDGRPVVLDSRTGRELFREAGDSGDGGSRFADGFAGSDRLWVRDARSGGLSVVKLPGWEAGPAIPGFPGSVFARVSPDGQRVAVSGRQALAVRSADATAPWVEVESYRDRPKPFCGESPPACAIPVRFSPDGRRLLTWDEGYLLWEIAARPVRVGRISSGSAREWWWPDASFSPDGRRLAAAVRASDGKTFLRIWETAAAAELIRLDLPGGATGCAFTPDGKGIVVAHPDTTFSVWAYAALEARATGRGGPSGGICNRLASPDPAVGQAAVGQLAADPKAALRLVKGWFAPPDPAEVASLIADLDSSEFPVREAASKALTARAEWAEEALQVAERFASAEVRRRAAEILQTLELGGDRPPEAYVRAIRVVEVLERIGTAEAQAILKGWAGSKVGLRGAEAKAALTRLAARR